MPILSHDFTERRPGEPFTYHLKGAHGEWHTSDRADFRCGRAQASGGRCAIQSGLMHAAQRRYAYLDRDIDDDSAGLAIGWYIAGSAVGGMSGLLINGVLNVQLHWLSAVSRAVSHESSVGGVVLRKLPALIHSSAKVGSLAHKYGQRPMFMVSTLVMVAELGLTMESPVAMILPGMVVFTFGVFGAHSVANTCIGRRTLLAKGQA